MGPKLTTIVVDSRLLFREALESLMRTRSYSIGSGVRFAAEIVAGSGVPDSATLVILGVQSTDTAITEAASVRQLLPDSKIVLLLEPGSPVDLDKLLGSEVDACVPMFVSADALIRTLDLIAATDTRVLIVDNMAAIPLSPPYAEANSSAIEVESRPQQADKPDATSVTPGSMADAHSAVLDTRASKLEASKGAMPQLAPRRILPELSEREIQILNGLVKGHANKVIARTCDITEATVKVHIRSILRKIRVGNRTQAAIWALESGYSVDVSRESH